MCGAIKFTVPRRYGRPPRTSQMSDRLGADREPAGAGRAARAVSVIRHDPHLYLARAICSTLSVDTPVWLTQRQGRQCFTPSEAAVLGSRLA
jgi:hypothetical protein